MIKKCSNGINVSVIARMQVPSLGAVVGTLVMFGCLFGGSVYASTDEQRTIEELRRADERQRLLREQFESSPDIRLEVPEIGVVEAPEVETPCFAIERIILVSEEIRRFRWLQRRVDSMIQQPNCIGAMGIGQIISEAQNELIDAGYVTSRILAEPQDMTQGVLYLTLLPGYLNEIVFEDGVPRRATYWNAIPVSRHRILNLRHIEQGLENFKRVPSVDAQIDITPANEPGYSDLVVQWQQKRPLRLTLTVDDSGSTTTGKYQGTTTISYDPYWAFNDLFYLTYNRAIAGFDEGDRGSQGVSGHFSVPFRYWLVSINGGYNDYYQTVFGAVEEYEYSGWSANQNVRLSRLIYRNARHKTTLHFNTFARQSSSFINDVEVLVQRRRTAGFELSIDHNAQIGALTLDATLGHKWGELVFGAQRAPEEAAGDGVSRPRIVTLEGGASYPFQTGPVRWSYSSRIRGQYNLTSLIPQDRFSIGGRSSVRGFDGSGGLSGERGIYARNELSLSVGRLPHRPFIGLDAGVVDGVGAETRSQQFLVGAAGGIRGTLLTIGYDAFVAAPISYAQEAELEPVVMGFQITRTF